MVPSAFFRWTVVILSFTCFLRPGAVGQAPEEKRLRSFLSKQYSWLVRPVAQDTDRLDVRLRFKLKRIVELNMKDQVLTVHLEVEHEWVDYKLKWNPDKYGGITAVVLPADDIWCPDTYLWNSFGDPSMKAQNSNAVIHHNGRVIWSPSRILQSFCPIEVRYYPFDIQTCNMTFGSWTYSGFQLQITLMDFTDEDNDTLPVGMSLAEYSPSSEWDLLAVPARIHLNYYICCKEPYYVVIFNVTLRRHSLVHLVNLVTPLIGISYLSLFVFYLPADSGEKITLCVSILMSQIMFLLLMMDNIPVTSLAVPLLGRLIVFNISLVFFSIVCTTFVLKIHYRKSIVGHVILQWARSTHRYKWLCRILQIGVMRASPEGKGKEEFSSTRVGVACSCDGPRDYFSASSKTRTEAVQFLAGEELFEGQKEYTCRQQQKDTRGQAKNILLDARVKNAFSNATYVAAVTGRKSRLELEFQEWRSLALLLDRLLLVLFHVVFYTGNLIILIDAPALFDDTEALHGSQY